MKYLQYRAYLVRRVNVGSESKSYHGRGDHVFIYFFNSFFSNSTVR